MTYQSINGFILQTRYIDVNSVPQNRFRGNNRRALRGKWAPANYGHRELWSETKKYIWRQKQNNLN